MNLHRLKDLREDKDLLQKDIAEKIGTSSNYYGDYENGKRLIPIDRLLILADYYDVSLDYITGRTNDKKGLSKSTMSPRETEVIKKFRCLNEQRKGEVIGTINLLFKQEQEEQRRIQDIG